MESSSFIHWDNFHHGCSDIVRSGETTWPSFDFIFSSFRLGRSSGVRENKRKLLLLHLHLPLRFPILRRAKTWNFSPLCRNSFSRRRRRCWLYRWSMASWPPRPTISPRPRRPATRRRRNFAKRIFSKGNNGGKIFTYARCWCLFTYSSSSSMHRRFDSVERERELRRKSTSRRKKCYSNWQQRTLSKQTRSCGRARGREKTEKGEKLEAFAFVFLPSSVCARLIVGEKEK